MYFSEHYQQHLLQLHGSSASFLQPLEIEGHELLSAPFFYKLRCLTLADNNALTALQGQTLCCEIGDKSSSFPSRFIHGIITRIEYSDDNSEQRICILTLQPEFAELEGGKRSRVWSNVTVSDIVTIILQQHKFRHPDIRLCNVPPVMEYKIQYRESDFEFIDRILFDAGICYFFIHKKDSHTMVLVDEAVSHPDAYPATLNYLPRENMFQPGYIWEWSAASELKHSSVSITGYNEKNTTDITIKTESSDSCINAKKCSYEDIIPDGNRDFIKKKSETIMACHDSQIQTWQGETCSWWLACGERFKLVQRENKIEDYRITSLLIRAENNYGASVGEFKCRIQAADNRKVLTARPKNGKPVIPGVLLARVVGPESEDIFTDEYGRVKIRFLWGKEALSGSEKTSCWVRVSQPWSGSGFGSQFIPRVGSEVLVSFIQGDPDYPVIVGSVYNGQNKPIFPLPGNKNKSGFITRSVNKGGKEEGHQLVFDDKKGDEKTTLSSSGDFYLTVKKDMVSNIDNAMSLTVAAGRTSEIKKGDDILFINQGDLQKEVTGNINIKVLNGNYNLIVSGGSGSILTDKKLTLESTQSVQLKVGTNEITLSPSGINIKGTSIKLEGQAMIEIKGAIVKLEGQAVTEMKGTVMTIQGSAMTQIKGGLINIG